MTPKKVRERASRAGAFTVVRGVLNTNRVQSVTRDGDMVTVTLAVDNGNGLTLNSGVPGDGDYPGVGKAREGCRPAGYSS
jgi:hypothetical protein